MQAETVLDLRYNIAALAIAILRDDITTAEQAFAILEKKEIRTVYKDNDIKDMFRLHEQGFSYREIGEIYGLSKDNVYSKIRRYKKETNSDCLKRSSK